MKWYLRLLLILILFSPLQADAGWRVVSSGSVSLANMRLSIVNGTAFVDFSAANALTNYLGRKIIITDSAGKTLTGYIKAAGTLETYGDDIFAALDLTAGWTASFSTIIDANTFETILAWGAVYKAGSIIAAALYKTSLDTSQAIGETNANALGEGVVFATDGESNIYRVNVSSTAVRLRCSEVATIDVVSASMKQVLTPGANGVTIVNTLNGITYNWEEEQSGFNRNDDSGYTYNIYQSSSMLLF